MALPRDEIARRIRAARELRGLDQIALGRLLAQDGLGAYDVGRIERGDMQMSRVQREAITRHLHIPERWLTAESVDEILGLEDDDGGSGGSPVPWPYHDGPPPDNAGAAQPSLEELRDQLQATTRLVQALLARLEQSTSQPEPQSRRAPGPRQRSRPKTG